MLGAIAGYVSRFPIGPDPMLYYSQLVLSLVSIYIGWKYQFYHVIVYIISLYLSLTAINYLHSTSADLSFLNAIVPIFEIMIPVTMGLFSSLMKVVTSPN